MGAARAVLLNDVRNTVRDRTIGCFVAIPFIFAALLRLGLPVLAGHVPLAMTYSTVIVCLLCGVAGVFPAFMMVTLMLEERDTAVSAVLAVLPVRPARMLVWRCGSVGALGALSSACVLFASGLFHGSVGLGVLFSVLCGMMSQTALLVVMAWVDNKIEGLALFKILFFMLFLAVLAQAWESSWRLVVAFLPPFWVSQLLVGTGGVPAYVSLTVSVVLHGGVAAVAAKRLLGRREA